MRRRPNRIASLLSFGALALVAACTSPTEAPSVDTAVQLAKGGGSPEVVGAVPAEGAQGSVSLQVRITGSGFDSGSNAVWLRNGEPAPDVQTNSTTYVSDSELLADITIDASAITTLYDIEVTNRRGKKGVGVEIFSVKEPGDVAPSYSLQDLGPGSAMDIGDNGVVLLNDGLWSQASGRLPLSYPTSSGGWGQQMSRSGGFAVGNPFDFSEPPFRWTLDGTAIQATSVLQAPPGRETQAAAVNDIGQAAGYGNLADGGVGGAMALFWDADGSMTVLPADLPAMDGARAWALNNDGHVGGDAPMNGGTRAVLWVPTESGHQVVELSSGSAIDVRFHVGFVGDVVDGIVIVGAERYGLPEGADASVIWTVDAVSGAILSESVFPDRGPVRDMSDNGDIANGADEVWNWLGGPTSLLPKPDHRCTVPWSRAISRDGSRVVGTTWIFSGNRRNGHCEERATLWTRVDP